MSNLELIQKANDLLSKKAYTRTSLAKELGISRDKLDRLARNNSIPKYPKALTSSQAATLGRKKGAIKWGAKFRLSGSPEF